VIARACETFQSQVTTSIATSSQLAALAALAGDKSDVAQMKVAYTERRQRILDGLRAIPGLRVNTPRGAFYAFVDVRALIGRTLDGVVIGSDVDLARLLLERERVAVVPGSAFSGPGYLRLSYAAALADIDEALVRIARLVAACN
jgi:aspartate aminotransferase